MPFAFYSWSIFLVTFLFMFYLPFYLPFYLAVKLFVSLYPPIDSQYLACSRLGLVGVHAIFEHIPQGR